jgi:hypothetical protein
MAITDNGPIRFAIPRAYRRPSFPIAEILTLPNVKAPACSLLSALTERRSADLFFPIHLNALATWLYFSSSIQSVGKTDRNRQQRYVPSFGALHATHILLGQPDHSWSVYLPERQALGKLTVEPAGARRLRESAEDHYFAPDAVLVLLLSNVDLASSYYDLCNDLLLREGGVIQGHASLVAAGLGLSCRILGGTGAPWGEVLIPRLPFRAMSVGTSWIGAARNGIP